MKKVFLLYFVVFLLLPVFAFSQGITEECIECSEPGGMVPCGRKCDDPTTSRNECLPCTLCDFFVMTDIIVDSIISGPLVAVLIIMIMAIMVMTAYARRGAPETINKAKKALTGVAIGVAITYVAWVIVYMVLVAAGAATWGGFDELWIINCPEYVAPESPELIRTSCGDNIIQRPNNDKVVEICDGSALSGQTCKSKGYESGDLACLADCSGFDESACVEYPAPTPLSLPTPVPMNPDPLEVYSEGEEYFMCDCEITITGMDSHGDHEKCSGVIEYDRDHQVTVYSYTDSEISWYECWYEVLLRLERGDFDLGTGYAYFRNEEPNPNEDYKLGGSVRCVMLKTIPYTPSTHVVPTGFCGDGIWQALNENLEVEYCDVDSFPPSLGSTCTNYINQPNPRQVVCTSECKVDISPCFAP